MAINIPIAGVQPTSILDALNEYANLRKNRVASQFAEPNAMAALLGTQLSNQAAQEKMPFIAPQAKANINKSLAEALKNKLEAQFVPTKYSQAAQRLGIEGGNLALNKQRFSPENLNILNQLRLSQIANATRGNQPVDIHGIPIGSPQGGVTSLGIQGMMPSSQNVQQQQTPSEEQDQWIPSNIGRSAKGEAKQFYNPKTKETLVPFTPKTKDKVLTANSAIDDVIPQIQKLIEYGKKAYLGAPSTLINKMIDPENNADYGSTLAYTKEKMLSATSLPRVKQAITTLTDINKRYAGETAEHYEQRANRLIDTLKEAKKQGNRYLRNGGYIIPAEGKEENQGSYNPPSFKNEKDYANWKSKASSEQKEDYRKYLISLRNKNSGIG